MKVVRFTLLSALLLSVAAPCFAHHLAVIVDKENKVDNVTSHHLAEIFKSEVSSWPDGKPVVLILHRNSSGEIETLQHINRMSAAELKEHIASHSSSIHIADSDDDVLKAVETTPGAIGFVDVRSINDHVKIVKVDGKLPLESGYLPH
jgi:phosphate transport system substrate-binding protein